MKRIFKKYTLVLLYMLFYYKKASNKLIVLTYHRVTDENNNNDPLIISKSSFEEQIKYLKENYEMLSGEKLLDVIKNDAAISKNSCLITFDDGWMDNYTNAFPILKKYKVPAIIFLTTDYIGTENAFWHEKLQEILSKTVRVFNIEHHKDALSEWPNEIVNKISEITQTPVNKRQYKINELVTILKKYDQSRINSLVSNLSNLFNYKIKKKRKMLGWEEILEMSNNYIHFASHTKSHPILTQIDDEKINEELCESKKIIEEKLGKDIYYFSYPNGNYNKNIMRHVKEANYIAAFAMAKGKSYSKDHVFEIKREMLKDELFKGINGKFSKLLFKAELSGIRKQLKSIYSK